MQQNEYSMIKMIPCHENTPPVIHSLQISKCFVVVLNLALDAVILAICTKSPT